VALLVREYHVGLDSARQLAAHFEEQQTVSEIPDPQTCLIEVVPSDVATEYYVHTPLHRAANDAVARVAVLRLARDFGRSATSLVADLGLLLCLGGRALSPEDWRGVLSAVGFEADLHRALANNSPLSERFQRIAYTGLMLLRNPLGRRRKVGGRDWPERCLFEQVRAADPDFVLLRQAAREVQTEVCDVHSALAFAERLPRRVVRCRVLAGPSPFARHWSQAVTGPAESPQSPDEVLRRLHAQLTGG